MQTEPRAHDGAADAARHSPLFPDNVVLLVGTYPGPTPTHRSVRLTLVEDEPCGLVVLLPGADLDATLERLAHQGRSVVPVADLSGGAAARADFCADFRTLDAIDRALAETQHIREALRSLPPIAEQANRDRLSILRLAYLRKTDIEARWDPSFPDMVAYPLLSGLRNCRSTLEQLARSGFLSRSFFDRVHVCGGCGSARLLAREVCVACGSSDLRTEGLIHHYRCANQAPRSQFEHDQELVCPKCNRALRHYGVDYDAPGSIQQCNQCHEVFAEADVAFKCADCKTATLGDAAATLDWYDYVLTPEGRRAATSGDLPSLELASFFSDVAGHRAPRDLALIIDFEDRVHRRYHRPFSIVTVSFLLSDNLRSIEELHTEYKVWDIIRGALRDPDFIAALEHQLVLMLPETEPAGAQVVVARINKLLAEATTVSSHIRVEVLADEKIPALLDTMRRA